MEAERAGIGSKSTLFIVSSALLLIALIIAISVVHRVGTPVDVSMIRVANGTGLPLQNVRINSIFVGDMPIDGVSRYQALAPAYRYAALRLEVAGKRFEMVPDDYVGETSLGRGSFTYRIRRQYHNGAVYFDLQDATRDSTE